MAVADSAQMPPATVRELREYALAQTLFKPTRLATALRRLAFVQADPIRSPARAQDLILRHRVQGYRAGDLERRYPELDIEEDMLYAYGFACRDLWRWLHVRDESRLPKFERQVLAAVKEIGDTHPRDLDERFGRKRVVNAWGGHSKATKNALESLHRRGLLRIARRDRGVRVYGLAPDCEQIDNRARFRELVLATVGMLAPMLESSLLGTLSPVRRRRKLDAKTSRAVVEELVASGQLRRMSVDGASYLLPAKRRARAAEGPTVRFLAPFDPVVWDRDRFEHLFGWAYRFEAYTPPAKRVRGYYAMPLLWGDDVVGWANVDNTDGELQVEVGFADKRPTGKAFARELDAEIERMRRFL